MKTVRLLFGVLIVGCAAGRVGATTIAVANYSFEQVPVVYGSYSANNIPSWNFTGFVSTYHPTTTEISGGVPDGVNVASVAANSSIWQTLGTTLTGNTIYSLKVGVGERTDIPSPGYVVSLFAGVNLLASESSQTLISGSFVTSTIIYNASAVDPYLGQALTIQMSVGGITNQTEFDNVRLDATATGAPEPGTFGFLGLGVGLVGWKVRRRTAKARLSPRFK